MLSPHPELCHTWVSLPFTWYQGDTCLILLPPARAAHTSGGSHRWELPVLHYHKIMVIYP